MRKLQLIDYVLLFALTLFTLMFTTSAFGQDTKRIGLATVGEDIYGTYKSFDGTQVLYMNFEEDGTDTFLRQSLTPTGTVSTTGKFTIEEKHLYVEKVNESYRLLFYLKGIQLIVHKPDSVKGAGDAWLFTKVSSYGLYK